VKLEDLSDEDLNRSAVRTARSLLWWKRATILSRFGTSPVPIEFSATLADLRETNRRHKAEVARRTAMKERSQSAG
jgi:hypothetical protein